MPVCCVKSLTLHNSHPEILVLATKEQSVASIWGEHSVVKDFN